MSMTMEDLDKRRQSLAECIAEEVRQFEADTGVSVQSVSGNPRRTRTPDGESQNDWAGAVRVRLSF